MKGIPGKGIPGNPRAYQFCVRKTGMKLELTTVCAFDFGNHAVQIQDIQFITFCYKDWHALGRRSYISQHFISVFLSC